MQFEQQNVLKYAVLLMAAISKKIILHISLEGFYKEANFYMTSIWERAVGKVLGDKASNDVRTSEETVLSS